MDTPRLKLLFVANAYTEDECGLIEVASIDLAKSPNFEGHWGTARHELVEFPNGESLTVAAEVTTGPNYLHVNDASRRLLSLKTSGAVDAMFLLPSGQEAYATLELPNDALIR